MEEEHAAVLSVKQNYWQLLKPEEQACLELKNCKWKAWNHNTVAKEYLSSKGLNEDKRSLLSTKQQFSFLLLA